VRVLRLLRWKRFVQGDEEQFMVNTRRYTQLTGVEVKVDSENWEDLRPKAAVAANVGAGPDIIISTDEQPHLYPDKLLDVTDVADYLGQKYGGWFDTVPEFGMHEGRWIAIPTGAGGGAMVYRKSMLQAAGFKEFPKDLNGFLKLCQALKAKGTPAGFALGHATGMPMAGRIGSCGHSADGWPTRRPSLRSTRKRLSLRWSMPRSCIRRSRRARCRGAIPATTRRFWRAKSASR
jgi:ABC-type glycerol-3-phosphate transport system substrate-binding protein